MTTGRFFRRVKLQEAGNYPYTREHLGSIRESWMEARPFRRCMNMILTDGEQNLPETEIQISALRDTLRMRSRPSYLRRFAHLTPPLRAGLAKIHSVRRRWT